MDTAKIINIRTIAIYGDTGSGKTSLAYYLIDALTTQTKRLVYFFRHPQPSIIKELGYHNFTSLEELENLSNCIVYLDEPQLYLDIHNRRANKIIASLCSLARQLSITLIISSSDTRVFTKHNESYFDLWLVKDLNYMMVKNGSMIKEVIKKNARFDPAGVRIKEDEFLAECRRFPDLNGRHTFMMVDYFTDAHSKPFALTQGQIAERGRLSW